jgi:membrane associated rhomboid family serine protease
MIVPYNVDVPMARVPIANWVLIGLTCLVSIVSLIHEHRTSEHDADKRLRDAIRRQMEKDPNAPVDVDKLVEEIEKEQEEAIPPLSLRWSRLVPLWLFTYQFVHADIWHLIGNMIFLFCFGNAVNAKLGHWQYIVSYLLLGALAGLAFLPLSHGRPIVGASGSIMGIVGLFVVLFPRNDVQIFYWIGWVFVGVTRITAYWVVLFYVVGDLIGALLNSNGAVAYAAHLVGAAAGVGLGIILVRTRVVRSTRYEENLLELLGYQRKGARKKKKAKRRPAPTGTIEELLANGSDYDICESVFRRLVRLNGGKVHAVGLKPEEQVAILAWYTARVVDEDGFRVLFQDGIPGDPHFTKTVEAYHTLDCRLSGNALRKIAAVMTGGPQEGEMDERIVDSAKKLARLPSAAERQFLESLDEVESRLVGYIRAHREFFLALDDEE